MPIRRRSKASQIAAEPDSEDVVAVDDSEDDFESAEEEVPSGDDDIGSDADEVPVNARASKRGSRVVVPASAAPSGKRARTERGAPPAEPRQPAARRSTQRSPNENQAPEGGIVVVAGRVPRAAPANGVPAAATDDDIRLAAQVVCNFVFFV